MSSFEPTIHCPPSEDPHHEPSVVLDKVWIPQSHLDGLNALLHFLDGMERGGQGRVPGKFELVMHLRGLRAQYNAQCRDTRSHGKDEGSNGDILHSSSEPGAKGESARTSNDDPTGNFGFSIFGHDEQ